MTTAHLSRKANGVSKGRHNHQRVTEAAPPERVQLSDSDSSQAPVTPAPKARFETPPCGWCGSENTGVTSERRGETQSRQVIDPLGRLRTVEIVGIAKYCKCRRCGHSWKAFFEAAKLQSRTPAQP